MFSTPPVTEMFHFTGCCDAVPMYSEPHVQGLACTGYPIRKSPDHSVFAAPRSLSQLITSFIAYWHQGIHYVLLVAFLFLITEILFCMSNVTKSHCLLQTQSLLFFSRSCNFSISVCGCQRTFPISRIETSNGPELWVPRYCRENGCFC